MNFETTVTSFTHQDCRTSRGNTELEGLCFHLESDNIGQGPAPAICVICRIPFSQENHPTILMTGVLIDLPFHEWKFIGETFQTLFRLCDSCSLLIRYPKKLKRMLMEGAKGVFEFVFWKHHGDYRFLCPAKPREQLIQSATFFEGRASHLSRLYCDPNRLVAFSARVEELGLRTVGCFSSDHDIAAVYHYAKLFAQEGFGEGLPYWFLDPRLIGPYRVAYLIKDRANRKYIGAVSFNTAGFQTLCWAYLEPSERKRGHLSRIWPPLEQLHPSFKVQLPVSSGMQFFLDKHPGHEMTELTGA